VYWPQSGVKVILRRASDVDLDGVVTHAPSIVEKILLFKDEPSLSVVHHCPSLCRHMKVAIGRCL
jgi:hypothetical protein